MVMTRILLIDNNSRISESIRDYLIRSDFTVETESHTDRAVEKIKFNPPDMIILETHLPGMDGLKVCRRIRDFYKNPILVLTNNGNDADELDTLEAGADDYLSKPVKPPLLLARIKTLLRRVNHNGWHPQKIQTDSVMIDASRRSVHIEGKPVELTTMEFDLLWTLAVHAGEAVSRDDINSGLRGHQWDGMNRSIDLSISRLRKKLGENGRRQCKIRSIRGTGYMWVP